MGNMGKSSKVEIVKRKKTRIQERNETRILEAAEEIFAEYGFHGATIDKVAEKADMSQPNLHHYYRRKSDLYAAVLDRTLEIWLEPLMTLDRNGEPRDELSRYIAQKIELSRKFPFASRVFANEIIQGAPILKHKLQTTLRTKMAETTQVIEHWISNGKISKVDPYHFIFMIWAATQHYADFLPQVRAVMGVSRFTKAHYEAAEKSICDIILNGVLPR
jgi:TetR/AcrR family transcriptional regulator